MVSDTKLADRTAAIQQAALAESVNPYDGSTLSPKQKAHNASREKGASSSPAREDAVAKIRHDLGEAQRSRGLIESRLHSVIEEFNKLKTQSSLDIKCISDLTKERLTLTTGMRDRDEELRGKAKLLEVRPHERLSERTRSLMCLQNVHDETVSLTLQLNMAEEQSQKLRRENRELVDRWMKRMGQEADAMNEESRFS